MKTILLICFAALVSCTSSPEVVPLVSNRDAQGRFIKPACPKCGESAVSTATVYTCAQKHTYATSFVMVKDQ